MNDRLDCLEAVDFIEHAVDRTIDDVRRQRLDSHVASCRECAQKLDDAHAVRSMLSGAERPACPQHVVDAILAKTVDAEVERRRRSPTPMARRAVNWRRSWGAVAAVVALLALVVPQSLQLDSNRPAPHEVMEATEQVRYAFAVLSREMTRTTDIIGGEIGRQFSGPLRDGLDHVGKSTIPTVEADDRQGFLSIPPRTEPASVRDIPVERT